MRFAASELLLVFDSVSHTYGMEKKTCGKCSIEKPIDEFHRQLRVADGRQSVCIECRRAMDRQRYTANPRKKQQMQEYRNRIKQAVYDYKMAAGGCRYCSETAIVALDFHHPDSNKEFNVSQWHVRGLEAVIAEMKKCEVVCANCHRKLHAGFLLAPKLPQPAEPALGLRSPDEQFDSALGY